MKEFDYYIFIDYSENLIGYAVINKERIKEILKKIPKIQHFKKVKHAKNYIASISKKFEDENITKLMKCKIKNVRANIELFMEIAKFIEENKEKEIFLAIDDNFYLYFIKFINAILDINKLNIIRESKLRKHSIEYKLSLIIDNLLTIERKKLKSN